MSDLEFVFWLWVGGSICFGLGWSVSGAKSARRALEQVELRQELCVVTVGLLKAIQIELKCGDPQSVAAAQALAGNGADKIRGFLGMDAPD
jgi:hypothetical protein